MNLETYFSENNGVGVLSTVSREGSVNSAIYARPHVRGRDTVSFIMRDRLTRANLQENESANYLFLEHEHGYKGVRMYLVKTEEVQDREAIEALSRRAPSDNGEERYLVTFRVDKVLELIGGEEVGLT